MEQLYRRERVRIRVGRGDLLGLRHGSAPATFRLLGPSASLNDCAISACALEPRAQVVVEQT